MAYKNKEKQKEWAVQHREELREYKREWAKKKKAEDPEKFRKEIGRAHV